MPGELPSNFDEDYLLRRTVGSQTRVFYCNFCPGADVAGKEVPSLDSTSAVSSSGDIKCFEHTQLYLQYVVIQVPFQCYLFTCRVC